MHLARIRIAELSSLEVDDEQATQPSVEEHEINAEPCIVDAQSTLTAKKGEVVPQLQQEVRKVLDECGFQIGFRVLVLKVEELQYERIFDRLFWGHGIARFGNAMVPLDETLVQAAVDLSGRPYVVHHEPDGMAPLIGTYDTTMTRHIFESLAYAAGICLHVRVIEGRNAHHIVEAQFKAVARALRAAAAPDPRAGGIPSTKGVLR